MRHQQREISHEANCRVKRKSLSNQPVTLGVQRCCEFVGIPRVRAIWKVCMRDVSLLERKYLTAVLATTLSPVDYPMNLDWGIQIRNFVGFQDIEMPVGAEKANISGGHCGTLQA